MRCLRSAGLPPSTGSSQKAALSPGCRTVSVTDWPSRQMVFSGLPGICRQIGLRPLHPAPRRLSCEAFVLSIPQAPLSNKCLALKSPDLACALPRPPLQAERCAEKDPRQPGCLGSFDTVLQRYLVRTRRTGAPEGLITSARPWRRPLPAASSEPRHPPWKHPPSGSWERPRR